MTRRVRSAFYVLLVCGIFLIEALADKNQSKLHGERLKAFLGPIPVSLDPVSVTSFTEYVVIQQLSRGLLKFGTNGEIAGDLAQSWTIEALDTRFVFELRENQFFSNNELVTAESFVGSINRQISKGRTIHYDFTNIKSVKALSNRKLEITLRKSDNLFLEKLSFPEFALLHSSDFKKPITAVCEWKITSGRNVLKEIKASKIVLTQISPESREVEIISGLSEAHFEGNEKIDFFVGIPPLSEKDHKKTINEYEAYSPRLGFTYFFSVGRGSKLALDRHARSSLFAKLYRFRDKLSFGSPFHFLAEQLYLPDGPGRTPKDRLNAIRSDHLKNEREVSKISKLKILVQKTFPYQSNLLSFLGENGLNFEIHTYANFDEYESVTKKHSFDIIQSNNDFSALDLSSNILVTLNPERPLVETFGDKEILSLYRSIQSQKSDEERIVFIQKIEERLLKEAFVFPLFHMNLYFYVRKDKDAKTMSRKFPEVALWKIN